MFKVFKILIQKKKKNNTIMTLNIIWHIKRYNSNNNNKKQIVYDIQYY